MRLPFSWILPPVLLTSAGCGGDDDVAYYESERSVPAEVVEARIDSDAGLAGRQPGLSVGVFVEYESGGHYRIDVTCDTEVSGFGCSWLVVAEPADGSVFAVRGHELEHSDDVEVAPTSVGFATFTNDDLDGLSFRTQPGVPLRLYVALDGFSESRFVFWVGNGAVHSGAPSVPFDLVPSEP